MSLEVHLDGLVRPALVEAVYLVGRYLSHRLTRDVFLRQLEAEVNVPDRQAAVGTALKIVTEIENREGVPIENLSPDQRASYADQLDEALKKRIERSTEAVVQADVNKVVAKLRYLA